jgi:hypothetical protein
MKITTAWLLPPAEAEAEAEAGAVEALDRAAAARPAEQRVEAVWGAALRAAPWAVRRRAVRPA